MGLEEKLDESIKKRIEHAIHGYPRDLKTPFDYNMGFRGVIWMLEAIRGSEQRPRDVFEAEHSNDIDFNQRMDHLTILFEEFININKEFKEINHKLADSIELFNKNLISLTVNDNMINPIKNFIKIKVEKEDKILAVLLHSKTSVYDLWFIMEEEDCDEEENISIILGELYDLFEDQLFDVLSFSIDEVDLNSLIKESYAVLYLRKGVQDENGRT